MSAADLAKLAKKESIEDFATLPKQKLVFQILKSRARKQGLMIGEGTLEIMPDGYGFLRSPEYSYLASPDDVETRILDGARGEARSAVPRSGGF